MPPRVERFCHAAVMTVDQASKWVGVSKGVRAWVERVRRRGDVGE